MEGAIPLHMQNDVPSASVLLMWRHAKTFVELPVLLCHGPVFPISLEEQRFPRKRVR